MLPSKFAPGADTPPVTLAQRGCKIASNMTHFGTSIHIKATVTLGRGLTRCPRIERNSRNRQSAPDRLQPRVLIRAVCLHTQTDEKWRTHTVEIVCERLNCVRA